MENKAGAKGPERPRKRQQRHVNNPVGQFMNTAGLFSSDADGAAPAPSAPGARKQRKSKQQYSELPTAYVIASAAPAQMALAVASPIGRAGSSRDGEKELDDIIDSLFTDDVRGRDSNTPLLPLSCFNYPDAYLRCAPADGEAASTSSKRSSGLNDAVSSSEASLSAQAEMAELSADLLPSSDLLDCSSNHLKLGSPPSEAQSDASSTLSNCRFSTTELLDLGEELLD